MIGPQRSLSLSARSSSIPTALSRTGSTASSCVRLGATKTPSPRPAAPGSSTHCPCGAAECSAPLTTSRAAMTRRSHNSGRPQAWTPSAAPRASFSASPTSTTGIYAMPFRNWKKPSNFLAVTLSMWPRWGMRTPWPEGAPRRRDSSRSWCAAPRANTSRPTTWRSSPSVLVAIAKPSTGLSGPTPTTPSRWPRFTLGPGSIRSAPTGNFRISSAASASTPINPFRGRIQGQILKKFASHYMAAHRISRACFLFSFGILCPTMLFAQSADHGSIEGRVTDPSAAAVPGATLRATDQKRGVTFNTTSNADGLFRFPALPVGIYELSAEHAGFARWVERNIEVTVGSQVNREISLQLAGTSESIVVRDPAPAVETTRSQVSFTVNDRSVSDLPTNGRNYLDFVLLTPGVTRGSRGTFDLSFAGQRKMNLLRVDGADNDNTFFTEALGSGASGQAPYQFSMSVVQEFQVNTNSYSAEFGRAGAGLINVVTKSGTNEFHGQGFWYYRDRSLNANDLVNKLNSLPKSPYHFNQFGGTFGGPLVHNQLFFFLAYDGQRSILQNVVNLNLPAGFALSPDPPVAAFQKRALDYLAARASSWLRTFDQNVYFAKLDWRVNSAHLLTGRWNRQRFTGRNLEAAGPQNSLEHTGNSLSFTDTLALALTSSISPSVANSLLFAYVRSREPGFSNSPNPEANVFEGGQLVLTVGRSGLRDNDVDRLQWSETVSMLRGRHALRFGGDVLPNWITFFTALNFSGSFRFPSLESFGRSLAAAPPALPDTNQRQYVQAFSGEGAHGVTTHPNFVEYGGFAQDEWRIHRRFTLNLGLRYDLQVIRKPSVRNPSPTLAGAGLDTSHLRTDYNNFAPRLGLAWAPLSSGRLVLRAGYGVFYSRTPSIIA